MKIRIWRMSFGARLSICYLIASSIIVAFSGQAAEGLFALFGFPLCSIALIVQWIFRLHESVNPDEPFGKLMIVLWILNAYFWGYSSARVIIPFLVWIYTDPPLTPEMQLPPELLRLKAERKK